jgi:hypothetical protein
MSAHDYLVLGIAVLFLVTNFFGLGFTIRRLRSRSSSHQPQQGYP